MNLSQLSGLGRVGGVPAIALGTTALVLAAVLGLTDMVPATWRGPLLLAVALGAVAFGVLALLAWTRGSRVGEQVARTEGNRSAARNEDVGKGGARQEATTRGSASPATNIRR